MADLEALKLKQKQLAARIQKAEAQLKANETKADNRVKVLVGAAILEQCRIGKYDPAALLEIMQGFLARPRERDAVLGEGDGSESFRRLSSR